MILMNMIGTILVVEVCKIPNEYQKIRISSRDVYHKLYFENFSFQKIPIYYI